MAVRSGMFFCIAVVASAQWIDIVGDIAETFTTYDFDAGRAAERYNCTERYLCLSNAEGVPRGSIPSSSTWKLSAAAPGGPFQGELLIAGPSSIATVSTCPIPSACGFHDEATEIRLAAELFTQYVNKERGGLNIAGFNFSLYYSAVEDYSNKIYVARAQATASRAMYPFTSAQFGLGPYSSDLTQQAADQTYLDDRILIASASASEKVIAQNDLTFGMLSPSTDYMRNPIKAVAQAAMSYDGNNTGITSLTAGFIAADTTFTMGVCAGAPDFALLENMAVASTAGGEPLLVTVHRTPSVSATIVELEKLRAAGVTVIIACTYDSTARTIIVALEAMDWTPLALVTTSSVGTQGYGQQVANGWWQGQYVIGPAIWYHTEPSGRRGTFSRMTSSEFYDRFTTMFGQPVSYHGAAAFGGLSALAQAIESAVGIADSVDFRGDTVTVGDLADRLKNGQYPFNESGTGTPAFLRMIGFQGRVKSALSSLQLSEFFAEIDFSTSAIGQNNAPQLVLQYRSSDVIAASSTDPISIVGGSGSAVAMDFPMESWKKRRCRAEGPLIGQNRNGTTTRLNGQGIICSNRGDCNDQGQCVCNQGFFGPACELNEDAEQWLPLALLYTAYGLVGLGQVFALVCLTWTFVKRKSKVLKASQPGFLCVVALGCFFSMSAIYPASFDHRYAETSELVTFSGETRMGYGGLDVACNLQIWIYSLGFCITFGALLTKLWRVMRIVNNTSVTLKHVSERKLWAIALVPFLFQFLVLVGWHLVGSLWYAVTIDNIDSSTGIILQQHGSCVLPTTLWRRAWGTAFLTLTLLVQLGLLLFGNVLCFRARGIPVQFAETKYIAFTMASHVQTKMFAVLAAIFIYNVPVVLFLIKLLVIAVSDIGTLALIFAPKFFMVHKEGEAGMEAAAEELREYAAKRWEKNPVASNGRTGAAATRSALHNTGECPSGRAVTTEHQRTTAGGGSMVLSTQAGASWQDLDPGNAPDSAWRAADPPPDDATDAASESDMDDLVETSRVPVYIPLKNPPPPEAVVSSSANAQQRTTFPTGQVPTSQSVLYGTHKPLAARPAIESKRDVGFWGRKHADSRHSKG